MTKHLDPNPAIETPEALMQKVECLERRMSTLEILLNDVMMQIDKPFKHENQFASKQKPNRTQPSNGKAKKKTQGEKRHFKGEGADFSVSQHRKHTEGNACDLASGANEVSRDKDCASSTPECPRDYLR